jgi:2-polyprenyl-6-methoxyphenol hydroxylase-like FAD-dependent oxidoreductase
MAGRKTPEVLVVGAGPVGLFTALALARKGVRAQIVDRDWRTGAHSYALALHPQSLRLFDELGLGQVIRSQAYRVETVGLFDGAHRRAEVRVGEPGGDGFLAVMPQDVLESLLESELKREGIAVLWNHEVSKVTPRPDDVSVEIEKVAKDSVGYAVAHTEWVVTKTWQQEAMFVVGADGHRSTVRRSLDIGFDEVARPQHFAVFEFSTDFEFNGQMQLTFREGTAAAAWPLPGGRCRWSFELTDFAAPATTRLKDRIAIQVGRSGFPVLSEDNLKVLLAERAPWFAGRVGEVHWRLVVRFERRLAHSFGRDRVWLVGDAAHTTGPAGMQSMNVGLQEGHALADAIVQSLRNGRPSDELRGYGERQTAHWQRLLRGRCEPMDGADPWLRVQAASMLPCLPGSGEDLDALAAQLHLRVTT